jgi:hypothetical protein
MKTSPDVVSKTNYKTLLVSLGVSWLPLAFAAIPGKRPRASNISPPWKVFFNSF